MIKTTAWSETDYPGYKKTGHLRLVKIEQSVKNILSILYVIRLFVVFQRSMWKIPKQLSCLITPALDKSAEN